MQDLDLMLKAALKAFLEQGLQRLDARLDVAAKFLECVLVVDANLKEKGVDKEEGFALEEGVPTEPVKDGAELSDRVILWFATVSVSKHVGLEVPHAG